MLMGGGGGVELLGMYTHFEIENVIWCVGCVIENIV